MSYLPRCLDQRLDQVLSALGGVIIEGSRACGKTSTGLHHAKSSIRLDEPASAKLAELDPAGVLAGEAPRLIDEWQLEPSIWNSMRHEIDARQETGQFILSGSATPTDDVRRHSGAGRIGRIRMRPMTLAESGESSRQVSLNELDNQEQLTGVRSQLSYRDLAKLAVRGGWPGLLGLSSEAALDFVSSYCSDIAAVDLPLAVGVRHDPKGIERLLISIARNISSETNAAKLARDMASDGHHVDAGTVRKYLDALERIFIFEEQYAWAASLRSRTRLRKQPKLHFVDPSIACAALRINAERLARDPELFGQVFESMVVRDIRVYAEARRGTVYHYRDESGLEVDIIIELADGGWAGIEVKLGQSMVEQAEANLIKLRDQRIDTEKLGEPAFLAVVTGTEFGYTLPSNVHVVPLGALTA